MIIIVNINIKNRDQDFFKNRPIAPNSAKTATIPGKTVPLVTEYLIVKMAYAVRTNPMM